MKNTISNFSIRFQLFGTVIVLGLLVFISSCKKDSLIQTGVQPEEDNLSLVQTDTFTIVASSYKMDSVRTDGVTSGVFGFSSDNIFGASTASFVVQLRPDESGVLINDISTVVVDSVVFSILPETCYGDITKAFSLSLYQLEDKLVLDSNYFNSQTFNYNTTPLSTINYDKINYIDTISSYETIDFKLDSAFGISLLEQINVSTDKDLFWDVFNGFVISPNTSNFDDYLMILSDIYNSKSKMTVYYRQNSTATDPYKYDFIIDNVCERINLFNNDYSSGAINSVFNNTAEGEEKLYLQDMSGVGINIAIPYLLNLYDGAPVVINKAELVVPVYEGLTQELPQHYEITLGTYNEDSLLFNTIDGALETHFTGAIQGNEFVFNITRDIQYRFNKYVGGENVNYGYSLVSLSPEQNTGGTVFWGTNPTNSAKKMKFVLTYSLVE